jgi:hypothetical protein
MWRALSSLTSKVRESISKRPLASCRSKRSLQPSSSTGGRAKDRRRDRRKAVGARPTARNRRHLRCSTSPTRRLASTGSDRHLLGRHHRARHTCSHHPPDSQRHVSPLTPNHMWPNIQPGSSAPAAKRQHPPRSGPHRKPRGSGDRSRPLSRRSQTRRMETLSQKRQVGRANLVFARSQAWPMGALSSQRRVGRPGRPRGSEWAMGRVSRNGKIARRGHYKDGLKHGHWTLFSKNGKKAAVGSYHRDKRHGQWRGFDKETTKLAWQRHYRQGALHGPYKRFGRTGLLELSGSIEAEKNTGVGAGTTPTASSSLARGISKMAKKTAPGAFTTSRHASSSMPDTKRASAAGFGAIFAPFVKTVTYVPAKKPPSLRKTTRSMLPLDRPEKHRLLLSLLALPI